MQIKKKNSQLLRSYRNPAFCYCNTSTVDIQEHIHVVRTCAISIMRRFSTLLYGSTDETLVQLLLLSMITKVKNKHRVAG